MYRAQYTLQTTDRGVLSFSAGDQFTVVERNNEHWWLVQNGQGQVGYVPVSYLVADEGSLSDVLLSIDRAIQLNEQHIQKAGNKCTQEMKNNLNKLRIHRQKVVAEHQSCGDHQQQQQQPMVSRMSTKRRAPPAPPVVSSSDAQADPSDSVDNHCPTTAAAQYNNVPAASTPMDVQQSTGDHSHGANTLNQSSLRADTTSMTLVDIEPPAGLGAEMVEHVRRNTALSYEKSKVAVGTVLSLLSERLTGLQSIIDAILDGIVHENKDSSSLPESNDAVRLRRLFDELESVKDDSQQRSWCLHEDEQTICTNLEDLASILTGANPVTCREVLASSGYTACHTLVLYYQMETRASIRLLLLQVFGAMCALDIRVVSELHNSILPLELARDIQDDLSDIQKMTYSALVLTMIFSTGEAVPLQYYEHLNLKFVEFLLDNIENPPPSDEMERIPDEFVKLVLSFNLHFELPNENLVMKAFAGRGTAKTFTEKIMLMFNRADDPVHMFEYNTQCPNSVIKFLSDIYSCHETANLLYTNDAKVLIDIIVRQLNDLSAGEKLRTDYLSLIQLLLANSDYGEHRHRQSELQSCFVRIAHEDKDGVDIDQRIVETIWKQFPTFFQDSDM